MGNVIVLVLALTALGAGCRETGDSASARRAEGDAGTSGSAGTTGNAGAGGNPGSPDPGGPGGTGNTGGVITHNVFYEGHSLWGGHGSDQPSELKNVGQVMTQAIVEGFGHVINWNQHTFAGLCLENADSSGPGTDSHFPGKGIDFQTAIQTNTWDVIFMTECQSIDYIMPNGYSTAAFQQYYDLMDFAAVHANTGRPLRVYWYETWDCRSAGTPNGCGGKFSGSNPVEGDTGNTPPGPLYPGWRSLIDEQAADWLSVVADINAANADDVFHFPFGSEYMGPFADAIDAGEFASVGLSDSTAIFETRSPSGDGPIHINEIGSYLLALRLVELIYGIDIRGAVWQIDNPVGGYGNYGKLTAPMAAAIQDWVCKTSNGGTPCP